ncbi:MAG TPA: hypothetical protein VL361_06580 [Candidatus Limnocylindrales bacterium]|nr:hypothetical protein [Candidatus Limnocylindrales bacterium]
MDTVEKHSLDQSELRELRAECQSLRQVVSALLVFMLLISAAFDIFVWRQVRVIRTEVRNRGPKIAEFVAEYNKVSAPAITDFVNKLKDYERTHPDLTPILKKYSLGNSAPTGALPASVVPGKK